MTDLIRPLRLLNRQCGGVRVVPLAVRGLQGAAHAPRRVRTHILLAVLATLKSDNLLWYVFDLLHARVDLKRLLFVGALWHLHDLVRNVVRAILHLIWERLMWLGGFGCGLVLLQLLTFFFDARL